MADGERSSGRSDGAVNVSPAIVAGVIAKAAAGVYGVAELADRNPIEGIARALRINQPARGVDLNIKDGSVEADVHVVIENGVKIVEVAKNVQSAVKFAIEKNVGLAVGSVNVLVADIRLPAEKL
jgi:uncharacterized alkaline shock family protein YloU